MSAVLILSPVIQKWTPFLHGLLFLIIGNFGTMSLQLLATIEVTFIKFSPHFRKLSLFFWNFISQLGTLLLIEFLQVGLLWNSKALYQFGTRLQWFLILVIVGGFKGFRVININAKFRTTYYYYDWFYYYYEEEVPIKFYVMAMNGYMWCVFESKSIIRAQI